MPLGLSSPTLIAIVILIASSPGCVLKEMREARWQAETDATLNPWLGKSKDERMKRIGPPEQCAKLSDGGEVCAWVFRGVSNAPVSCPPDYVNGGHQCRGGGGNTWEHHAIFTYSRAGIAEEWNYRGSQGQRSSNDSHIRE